MMENEAMAEYVSKENFDEYARRMDERFDHVIERSDKRFLSLEKHVDVGFAHVGERFDDLKDALGQRFDSLEKRMDGFHADMRQMRGWLIWLFGLVVFGFVGSLVLMMLRDVIFK